MRKFYFIVVVALLVISSCSNNNSKSDEIIVTNESVSATKQDTVPVNKASNNSKNSENIAFGIVNHINEDVFAENIFDFRNEKSWNYNKELPCVVDFYTDWCGPCKKVTPILGQLAQEYKGKVYFYKVNIDDCREVAAAFNIQSIPTVMFCGVK